MEPVWPCSPHREPSTSLQLATQLPCVEFKLMVVRPKSSRDHLRSADPWFLSTDQNRMETIRWAQALLVREGPCWLEQVHRPCVGCA